ncbi:Transcription factor Ovo 2 [Fasciola gigantica]|uniref:Transcription factor Ovo 2 n=1 Tax=Fasciola gigantica TaxID=46835 RepID=A0A504YAC4_FASGI|nr:Transcription factor Ovo 2 [Fasciola gigantica]
MKYVFTTTTMEDIPFHFGQASSTPRRHNGSQQPNDSTFFTTHSTAFDQPYATKPNTGTRSYGMHLEDLCESQHRQLDTGSTLISSSSPPPTVSFSPPSEEYVGLTSSVSMDDGRCAALDLRINRGKRNASPILTNSDPDEKKPHVDFSGTHSSEFHIQALLSSTNEWSSRSSTGTDILTEQKAFSRDFKNISLSSSNLIPETTFSLLHAMNIIFHYLNQKTNSVTECPKPSTSDQLQFNHIAQLLKMEPVLPATVPAPVPTQPTPGWTLQPGSAGADPRTPRHHHRTPHHHHSFVHGHVDQQHCLSILRDGSPNVQDDNLQATIPGGVLSSDRCSKAFLVRRRTDKTGPRTQPDTCSAMDTTSSESERSRLRSNTDLSEEDAPGKGPIILYYPEPADSKNQIRAMLVRNDPRLRYVNDGAAIRNPFAVDRKIQLAFLTNLLLVRPYVCPECGRSFSQRCSLEGHRRKIHQIRLNYSRNQRREVVRVCESCGFACSNPAEMVQHTITYHPKSSSLPRLQRQLARMEERTRRTGDPGPRFTGIRGPLRSKSSDQFILPTSFEEDVYNIGACPSSVDEVETNRSISEIPLSVAVFANELNSFDEETSDEDGLDVKENQLKIFASVTEKGNDTEEGAAKTNEHGIDFSTNDSRRAKTER